MLLTGDRIAEIGPSKELEERHGIDRVTVVDGSRLAATPGLVDTHVHVVETLSRAAFPDNLETRAWVFHWAKPYYAHLTPQDEEISALLAFSEMARGGTTCFLDMGAQNDVGVIAKAAHQAGLRGITGRFAADRRPQQLPPGWSEEMADHHFFPSADAALTALEEAVRDWDGYGGGRIRCWVNIEGKEPCSPELHTGAVELARRLGVGCSYHIASSIGEARISQERFGEWPISRIARIGALGEHVVLAHATAVLEHEVTLLADTRTGVAFCPFSSLKLAKGASAIGRYPEMRKAGVIVGLGTDGVAAAGNFNMMRQLPVAAGLFKDARMDGFQLGAQDAFQMATIDGARALRWDHEIGSLSVGKKADFLLFDLNHAEWIPYSDPLQALVWSATSASLVETWVDGVPIFREGRMQTFDEDALREEAFSRSEAVLKRAGLYGDAELPLVTTLYGKQESAGAGEGTT